MINSSIVQGLLAMWVDDPQVCGNFLRSVFTHLEAVKDDLFHWLDRINRTIPSGHPLKGKLTVHRSTIPVVKLSCLLHNLIYFWYCKHDCLSAETCFSSWHNIVSVTADAVAADDRS